MKKNFFILRTLCFLCSFECLWATFVERVFCTRYFTEIVPTKSINPGVLLSPRFTFLVCRICYLGSLQKFTLPLASGCHTRVVFLLPFCLLLLSPLLLWVLSPPESDLGHLLYLTLLTFSKPVSEQQQQKTQMFFLTSTSHSPWLNDLWNFMFSSSLLYVKMIDPIDILLFLAVSLMNSFSQRVVFPKWCSTQCWFHKMLNSILLMQKIRAPWPSKFEECCIPPFSSWQFKTNINHQEILLKSILFA